MWHQDRKWANTVEKMVPIDLLNAGLPKTFNLFKKKNTASAKWDKAKLNKNEVCL